MSIEAIIGIVIGFIIWLFIMHEIIRSAVKAAGKEQRILTKRQNDILLLMLNRQGVDKDELMEIFITEKKDFWPSLKNHPK